MKNKLLASIPIAIFIYLMYVNILPFGGTAVYSIDVGADDLQGAARLTGPAERISEPEEADGITFRNLLQGLVYFDLKSSSLKNRGEVTVIVLFRDNFPAGQKFMVGAKNNESWSYSWKVIAANPQGNEWKLGNATWNLDELYIKDNALSFSFNTPHLGKEEFRNYTIPVDRIEIKIKTPPIWERI